MQRIRRLWAAYVELLSRREPGHAIALFRIAVGAVALWALLSVATSGLTSVLWVDRAYGGYRSLGDGTTLVRWLGGPKPGVIYSVLAGTLVSSALVVVGFGGRISAFVALQGYIALTRLDPSASGSSDILVTNGLWLLVIARSTAALSLDRQIRKRRSGGLRDDDELVSAFPRYLAVLQLIVMYWSTGLQKLSVYWLPTGSYAALYYIVQDPAWQRIPVAWAARAYPLTQIATAVTWLWEVTAPLLLLVYYYRATKDRPGRLRRWMNRWDLRKPWAIVGVTLHVMIFATMDVGHFSPIALAFYFCLWSPAELGAARAGAPERAATAQPGGSAANSNNEEEARGAEEPERR